GDITLHFIIFDILYKPEIKKTIKELIDIIDSEYLSFFENPMTYDESTLRKKLKKYSNEGIIVTEKRGREILYSRAMDTDISQLKDALDYFSETASCGAVGSFILDKFDDKSSVFLFKHHYITQTMDSDVLADLYSAMRGKKFVTLDIIGNQGEKTKTVSVVPLKIYISVQSGRQYLLAYSELKNKIYSYRLEYTQSIKEGDVCDKFDKLRNKLNQIERHMWGVNCKWNLKNTEHIEFTVYVGNDEQHIVHRLEREKRCGYIEKIDDNHYKFTADVFDSNEMVPWIRTFICRITELNFSNSTIENRFKRDIEDMYQMYEIGGESI
ncbi:MAG: WYL domain-containing transcriptional regulator, partial [Firmicutes bacterium]|nr:WYL domain-containing transcriptional regulator [Bacillota bacterium]